MLKLKVTYFLNATGLSYFPTWYSEVLNETSKQDGFIDMQCLYNGENPKVYLNFENKEKLNLWILTDLHEKLVEKIEPYFIEPEEVEIDEGDENIKTLENY